MPERPRKCCGKNVRLTPTNITEKWILAHVSLSVYPVNKGNQWTNPPIIANTAPIDNT